jgi:hypothetical protein
MGRLMTPHRTRSGMTAALAAVALVVGGGGGYWIGHGSGGKDVGAGVGADTCGPMVTSTTVREALVRVVPRTGISASYVESDQTRSAECRISADGNTFDLSVTATWEPAGDPGYWEQQIRTRQDLGTAHGLVAFRAGSRAMSAPRGAGILVKCGAVNGKKAFSDLSVIVRAFHSPGESGAALRSDLAEIAVAMAERSVQATASCRDDPHLDSATFSLRRSEEG